MLGAWVHACVSCPAPLQPPLPAGNASAHLAALLSSLQGDVLRQLPPKREAIVAVELSPAQKQARAALPPAAWPLVTHYNHTLLHTLLTAHCPLHHP